MQKKTSIKTVESSFKGTVKQYIDTKQKGYKRGDVAIYTRNLIRQVANGNLTLKDFEIANKVKEKFGGATSTKAIQWYKYQMRKEGLIANYPPRKVRKYIIEAMYEITNMADVTEDIQVLSTKKLIAFSKKVSKERGFKKLVFSSVVEAINFLNSIDYIIIEQNNIKKED